MKVKGKMVIRQVGISILGFILVSSISVTLATAQPQAKTYTVNSDTDAPDANPGNGICATAGGKCTLRAAIQEANLDGVPSTINFASTFQGTHTILGCNLPALTENNTTIDGSNRWDKLNHRPGVELTGGACTMLTISSNGNTILGLFFGGSSSVAVYITQGGNNTIGGSTDGQRNVFLVGEYGVWLLTNGTNNQIVYNYFGTIDGESLPGGGMGERGVFVQSGKQTNISNNLIVGQSDAGVFIWNDSNVVTDNIIGMSWNKSKPLPNKVGVLVDGDNNVIGPYNVIGGNSSHGIYLYHAQNTSIMGNYVGYAWFNGGNGEDGIRVHVSDNTVIGQSGNGNSISDNAGNGIFVYHAAGNLFQGNGISGSGQDGIHMESSSGKIGGVNLGEINSIGSSQGDGIHLNGSADVTIWGNYIGLGSGAFDAGNQGHGVLVDAGSTNNVIGGENRGEGNWIGWNQKDGVRISGNTTHDNFILGNFLGVPINWGWEAWNGNHGISVYDGAYNNQIGDLDGGNIVMASGWSGIVIVDSNNNAVVANRIGTDGASTHWGNVYYGVDVTGNGSGNAISFNEIAYNGTHNGVDNNEAGVHIDGAWANIISQNSIHDNDGPGIKLVNGGNTNLDAPIIDSASCSGPVEGRAGGPGWIIEIFSDNSNEGRIYEGNATADPGGHWQWNGTPNGPKLTATARAQSNDTSPFSAIFQVGTCNAAPVASFTINPVSGPPGTAFTFDASSSSDQDDPTSALQVRWDWENDGTFDTNWSTTKIKSHTFNTAATYTIRLEVKDTGGLIRAITKQVKVDASTSGQKVYLPLIIKE
jgi:CSLREA domain-containing protein